MANLLYHMNNMAINIRWQTVSALDCLVEGPYNRHVMNSHSTSLISLEWPSCLISGFPSADVLEHHKLSIDSNNKPRGSHPWGSPSCNVTLNRKMWHLPTLILVQPQCRIHTDRLSCRVRGYHESCVIRGETEGDTLRCLTALYLLPCPSEAED